MDANISRLTFKIIDILNEKFPKKDNLECDDVKRIYDICNLYKIDFINSNNSTSEIDLNVNEIECNISRINSSEFINTNEFITKYNFFVRIIYFSLKLDIEIFSIKENIIILKNNYNFIKYLNIRKKKILTNHIKYLEKVSSNNDKTIPDNFVEYQNDKINSIVIINKIINAINNLNKKNILKSNDNLLVLILPYFYSKEEVIEEYNGNG